MGLPVAIATDFNPGSTFCSSMPLMLTLAVTRMRLSSLPKHGRRPRPARQKRWGKGAGWERLVPGWQADFALFPTRPTTNIFLTTTAATTCGRR